MVAGQFVPGEHLQDDSADSAVETGCQQEDADGVVSASSSLLPSVAVRTEMLVLA